jgi:glycosyltransferase involved in cell wall biosynthesis
MVYNKLRSIPADALLMTGHHFLTMLALGDVCRGSRVLDLHSDHGATGAKSASVWRLIYRIAVMKFQAITFPSDFVRHEAEAIYPPIAKISFTLRNPYQLPRVPDADDRSAARELLLLPNDAPVIGNAGWLIPRKRFDIFLKVGRLICQKMPETVLVVVGDGPERERLTSLASQLGISRNIKWLGWQEDMTPFFHSIDVLLFNSDWDAMPRTPIEALSYGLPVVASQVHGGLSELVEHEQNGFLLHEHDLHQLADFVLFSLSNPGEARRRGLAGRQHLAELGSVADNAHRMENLLRGL